jgi:hypothetical protein
MTQTLYAHMNKKKTSAKINEIETKKPYKKNQPNKKLVL